MGGVWLAIDTATDIASVAVGKPPDTEAGVFVQGARRHAAEIIVLIEHALEQAGVRPHELEGIVVGDGPGSFTGLRIGWAAAMRYRDDVLAWSGAEPTALESLLPNATTLLSLVARAGATRQLDDPLAAEPLYGRPAEAQAKWEARHGRPLPDPSRPAG